jgi:DNA-binding transcriptional ArsR family regulator
MVKDTAFPEKVVSLDQAPGAVGQEMAIKQSTPRDVPADLELDHLELMLDRAKQASEFLKALSHESRLLILCHLSEGGKSVSDLEELLALRQSTVSQQLARLRLDGLVETKREGKSISYSLANEDVRTILKALYGVFCAKPKRGAR